METQRFCTPQLRVRLPYSPPSFLARLAQSGRAAALHADCWGFDSLAGYHFVLFTDGRIGVLIGLENRDGLTAVGVRLPYHPPFATVVSTIAHLSCKQVVGV